MGGDITKASEDQTIENIVAALQGYALDDIRFNKGRLIAAAILCASLIDQLSGFVSPGKTMKTRMNAFMHTYLPTFEQIKIYENFRNPIVHNYSLGVNISVSSDKISEKFREPSSNDGVIYMPGFIDELEKSVAKAVNDLRTDRVVRARAIAWEADHKILGIRRMTFETYSDSEVELLMSHYLPMLVSHPKFKDADNFNFYTWSAGDDTFVLYVGTGSPEKLDKTTLLQLAEIAQQLDLTNPMEFLNSLEEPPPL